MPRILRLSLRSFCSSSVSSAAVVDEAAGQRDDVEGDRRRELHRRGSRPAARRRPGRRRRSATLRTCSSSSSTPAEPGAGHGLVGAHRPADGARLSRWSGFSTGMATIVVQLGLATMPFGIESRASALTSGTTSGTSGSMRQADELSITMAPAAATGAPARARWSCRPRTGRGRARRSRRWRRPRRRSRRPATAACDRPSGPRRRSGARRPGTALVEDLTHDAADLAGGAEDADAHGEGYGRPSPRAPKPVAAAGPSAAVEAEGGVQGLHGLLDLVLGDTRTRSGWPRWRSSRC